MTTRTSIDAPQLSQRPAKVATCFCGAVEIAVTGEPLEMGYCHCTSCRSYNGTPLSSYMLWAAEQVRVTRGEEYLGGFAKTEMSYRRFCVKCGGHLMTNHPGMGLIDVYASLLAGIPFKPVVHLNYAETVLPMRDGLPKLRDFPSAVGGSGEMIPE